MGLKQWRRKFCPQLNFKDMTPVQAVQHALRKWRGLCKENLRKYGMVRRGKVIWDKEDGKFAITTETCSLCYFWYGKDDCNDCPLARVNEEIPCCAENGAYSEWLESGHTKPIIRGLENALKLVKAEAVIEELTGDKEIEI